MVMIAETPNLGYKPAAFQREIWWYIHGTSDRSRAARRSMFGKNSCGDQLQSLKCYFQEAHCRLENKRERRVSHSPY